MQIVRQDLPKAANQRASQGTTRALPKHQRRLTRVNEIEGEAGLFEKGVSLWKTFDSGQRIGGGNEGEMQVPQRAVPAAGIG
ncbi:hypothetical protein [Noviherbaspirillum sp. ST9]|uniref:hypothetical protein n=1 Tax=Noviherbaspirillum sp. ST9 TaxID=3401606 RepID=UPI003B589661